MTTRLRWIGALLLLSLVMGGCVSESQLSPSPTVLPITSTPVPPTVTLEPPTSTPSPPTAEPTTPPVTITSIEEMADEWFRTVRGDRMKISIFESGEATISFISLAGNDRMEIWFEDGVLYAGDHPACETEDIGSYEVQGVPDEYLVFTLIDDSCARDLAGKWSSSRAP